LGQGFLQQVLLLIEHQNPDIACQALKLMQEVAEERSLQEDKFVDILVKNEFVTMATRLACSEEKPCPRDTCNQLLAFLLVLSEKSKLMCQKMAFSDNLLDFLLHLSATQGPEAFLCSEILANLVPACSSSDLRSKIAINLQGIARLAEAVTTLPISTDEDLEHSQNMLDVLCVLVLDSRENCDIFLEAQGY
jgi:hypothetical protein